MKKFIVATIPILALAIFVLVMLSGNFLKKSIGNGDSIPQKIEEIITDINSDKWDEATIKTDDLKATWNKVIKRIQFSSERDEINYISTNIARLYGAISLKDKTHAVIELKEAHEHWDELGN